MMAPASGLLAVSATIALGMVIVAMLLLFWRVLVGPTLSDRVIAADLFATMALGLIGIYVIRTGEPAFLDAGLVLTLVAFLGSVAFARYLERGRQ
jgi:multicomponent Na+:H+ antiporter subunit F